VTAAVNNASETLIVQLGYDVSIVVTVEGITTSQLAREDFTQITVHESTCNPDWTITNMTTGVVSCTIDKVGNGSVVGELFVGLTALDSELSAGSQLFGSFQSAESDLDNDIILVGAKVSPIITVLEEVNNRITWIGATVNGVSVPIVDNIDGVVTLDGFVVVEGNVTLQLIAGNGAVDAGRFTVYPVTAEYINPGTRALGSSLTPELIITYPVGAEVTQGLFSVVYVGTYECNVVSYANETETTGRCTCDKIDLDQVAALGVPVALTFQNTVINATETQDIISITDITFVNAGRLVVVGDATATEAPSVTFTIAPAEYEPVASDFGSILFGVGPENSCNITSFNASFAKCAGTVVYPSGSNNISVSIVGTTFENIAGGPNVVISYTSVSFTSARVLVGQVTSFPVIDLVAPNDPILEEADIESYRIGTHECTTVKIEGTYEAQNISCGESLTFAALDDVTVNITLAGGSILNVTGEIALLEPTTNFTQTSDLAVGAASNFSISVSSAGADFVAGDITAIYVGDQSCTVSTPVDGFITCDAPLLLAEPTGSRPVLLTILGVNFTAGDQVVRGPHQVPEDTNALHATGSSSLTFVVIGIDVAEDISSILVNGTNYEDVACVATAYDEVDFKVTCSLAQPLPTEIDVVLSVKVVAFGLEVESADIGYTASVPSVTPNPTIELAVGLTTLDINGTNLVGASELIINGEVFIAANFSQVGNAITISTETLSAVWSLGQELLVMVKANGHLSEEVSVGTVTDNPTLVQGSRVWAVPQGNLTAEILIFGTEFGSSKLAAAITAVSINDVACAAFDYKSDTFISCWPSELLAAGSYNVSVTLKGGFTVSQIDLLSFAEPLEVTTENDFAKSLLPTIPAEFTLSLNATPFTEADLVAYLSDGGTPVACDTTTIQDDVVICQVSVEFWASFPEGPVYAVIESSGSPSEPKPIGYLHGGLPSVGAVPGNSTNIGLRAQEIFIESINMYKNSSFGIIDRTFYTLTFADSSTHSCTPIDEITCSLDAITADLPSGIVRVTGLTTNSYVAVADVTIGTVITPVVMYVQFESGTTNITNAELGDIASALATELGLTVDDIRVELSGEAPQSKKRAITLLKITTLTPEAKTKAESDVDGFKTAVVGAVTDGAPGASDITVFEPTVPPAAQPTNGPIDEPVAVAPVPPAAQPTNGPIDEPVAVAPVANPATDSNTPEGLSGGAIAGIVIGVLVVALILFAIIFVLLRRKRRADNWSRAAENYNYPPPDATARFSGVFGKPAEPARAPEVRDDSAVELSEGGGNNSYNNNNNGNYSGDNSDSDSGSGSGSESGSGSGADYESSEFNQDDSIAHY
jgi:hypothetical protein